MGAVAQRPHGDVLTAGIREQNGRGKAGMVPLELSKPLQTILFRAEMVLHDEHVEFRPVEIRSRRSLADRVVGGDFGVRKRLVHETHQEIAVVVAVVDDQYLFWSLLSHCNCTLFLRPQDSTTRFVRPQFPLPGVPPGSKVGFDAPWGESSVY